MFSVGFTLTRKMDILRAKVRKTINKIAWYYEEGGRDVWSDHK